MVNSQRVRKNRLTNEDFKMALVNKSDLKTVFLTGLGIAVGSVVLVPLITSLVSRFKI